MSKDLSALFLLGLKDINFTEHAILDALPKLADAATSPRLKHAFETHLRQTEKHVERLERIFDLIRKKPVQVPCDAIEGLVKEGVDVIEKFAGGSALDAGLIAATQAIEHYEMARYGALRAWADELELREAADLLGETLREEKQTDLLLTELAEQKVNLAALP
ncbi:MAG: ferritin-like domain-containing protein [Methylovirgula sp.]